MCLHYPYEEKQKSYSVRCEKCSGYFKMSYGGKSKTQACRYHKIDKNGLCEYCNNIHNNCYHIRRKTWLEWLFG